MRPPMPLDSGTKLGQYEISDPIGAGGMGEVYRARDTRLGREIALKILPESFARDGERTARFEREAKVLASLNHPNVAAIYGFEESSRGLALVMELVEGPTLAAQIAKGPIPVSEALSVAKQIAEGLEYAHERGIVHRDLKPANVKVNPDGGVKILDFGLAKAVQVDSAPADLSTSPTLTHMATQAGVILGTAAYMSPEQAKGKAVDRRADVWSFGCILFEMLTGKQVFAGETVTDVLAAVVRAEPDWTLLPSATPSHVRVLLKRCLQKDPRHRLRDIGDARISLEEVLSGAQESFSSAGISHPLARRALPWALAGLLVGALLAGVVVWKFFAPASQSSMHFSAVTNFAGVQAQPALSPDGRSVAFVSNRDGHYNIYVGLITGGSLVQITNDDALKGRPSWSPDGTSIAYAKVNPSGIWDIWVVPALGGNSRRLFLNALDPAWSPDGASLAYENGADGSIWISSVSGENAHQAIAPSTSWIRETQPRFSPDGRRLAFIARNDGPYGELLVADISSGKVTQLTSDIALALSPAWSPDGRFIYFCSSRGGTMNIWKIASAGGAPEQITAGQGDDAQLDLSSDGKKIVFSTWRQNNNIAQLDVSANSDPQLPKLLTNDPVRNQVAPEYSPDGAHLTYFSNMKGAEKEGIWVSNADGSNPVQLVRDNFINIFPNWTYDNQHVVYEAEDLTKHNENEYRIVPVFGGRPETLYKGHTDLLFDLLPDGRLIFRDEKDQVLALDLRDKTIHVLGSFNVSFTHGPLRGSPDGKSVAYILSASRENDPNEGVWVTDFKNPPHQVYRGWAAWWLSRGPQNEIYFLAAKPDLTGELWKVGWDGHGLTRLPATIPLIQSYWVDPAQNPQDHFAVSPDGRHIAFEAQSVRSANIGMIDNVR